MTARRLAALCRQSRSRNFQEEALQDAPDDLRAQVLEEYRRMVRDSKALLGHRGRWYEEQHMAVDCEDGAPTI